MAKMPCFTLKNAQEYTLQIHSWRCLVFELTSTWNELDVRFYTLYLSNGLPESFSWIGLKSSGSNTERQPGSRVISRISLIVNEI